MIQVSVIYPNDGTTRFDIDYYCNRHIPLVQELVGEAIRATRVVEGVAGGGPGQPPAYHAMAFFDLESAEAFQSAFGPHVERFLADMPNYTDAQPVLQVSEIKI